MPGASSQRALTGATIQRRLSFKVSVADRIARVMVGAALFMCVYSVGPSENASLNG